MLSKDTLSIISCLEYFLYQAEYGFTFTRLFLYHLLFLIDYLHSAYISHRCCVQVHLTDSSGVIPATIFGDDAGNFLSCSSKQLMENSTKVCYTTNTISNTQL